MVRINLDKMFEMKEKPRLEWMDILAGGMIYIGFLLFLVILHLGAISFLGDLGDMFSTAFNVMVNFYVGMIIFGLVGMIIQLLRWLVWSISIPEWKKKGGGFK